MKNIKRNIALYFIHFLFFNAVFSQNQAKILYDSINVYLYKNPNLAKTFSFKLLKLAKENHLESKESNAYFYLADLSGTLSQKDSAFYYYERAIQKAIENNDENLLLIYKVNKSNYLFNQFDFEAALTLYNECLKLAKKNNNIDLYDYILIKKASINYELGKYSNSLKVFKEGLKKKNFEINMLLEIELSIAKTYIKLKELDSAQIHIKKGIIKSKKNNVPEFEIHFLDQQGQLLTIKKRYIEAHKTFDLALFLAKKNQNEAIVTPIQINLSKLFLVENNYKKALVILESQIEKDKIKPIPIEYLSEIYYLLAESNKLIGKISLSNNYYQKFIEKSKKLGEKKIQTINYLHNLDVSEIGNQKKTLLNERWILILVLISFIVFTISIYFVKKTKDQIKLDAIIQKKSNYKNKLSDKTNDLMTNFNEPRFLNMMKELETANKERLIAIQQKILTEKEKEKLEHELMTNNLQLENHKEILKEIREKLPLIKSLNASEIKIISKNIEKNLEVDDEFELLKSSFENTNPIFFTSLQDRASGNLTKLDLKYCGYIKLGIDTKQIANIMNIEAKSMRMARYRIRKKLNLNKKDDLDDFINKI
jgi:tetratricopeptide (TPR) repeat protein